MMIKENLLVLPALSFGACLVHVGKDRDLARWDLGAGGPPWRAARAGAGVPSVRRGIESFILTEYLFFAL